MNTLLKGKLFDFFRLMKKLEIPYLHVRYLLEKGDYHYKAGAQEGSPLLNDYHFKS